MGDSGNDREPLEPNLTRQLRNTAPREAATVHNMVRRALDEGRVIAAFQPVVDARNTRRIAFHEVLLRLRSTTGGLLVPNQFLPSVVDTPLGAEIGRVILKRTLELLRRHPEVRLSLNVAPGTLDDPVWMNLLASAAAQAPDVGYRLIVEMTEDVGFLRHPRCPAFMTGLRTLGVSLALDDFGAGATGFHRLRDLRFDILKIDGSYGDGLSRNPDSQALIRAMVGLARHFEMMTVLEYIETQADADCASRLGIDCLQGHHFGRPTTALDLGPRGGLRDQA